MNPLRPEFPIDPHSPGDQGPPRDMESLRFARLVAGLGLAILLLALVLLALPSLLQGAPILYLIAFGIAALFGPVGFWLIGEAWRIRNRVLHGTDLPPGQRRRLRLLGAALIGAGLLLAMGGFGASGTISRVLDLVWGLSLAMYGLRLVMRSFVSERE
jgi:hypothetical protein